jgi:hypothetical protein
MDNFLMILNQNKIMWGVSMLLLNIGSRYVIADLGKSHEYILTSQIVKKLVVMSMFFVATRDLLTSFLLTVAYILIVDGVLHEKKHFCLLPKSILDKVNNTNISNDDYLRAKNIINIYEKQNKETETQDDSIVSSAKINKEYINYLTNLASLKYM